VNDWIEDQRAAARVSAEDDIEPHLRRIEDWQKRARAVANNEGRHATKTAVQECPPTDAEARALHTIYAIEADTVYHICREAYSAYMQSSHAQEPHLSLDDVLVEAYPLYLRAMVRYQGTRPLEKHLLVALRNRVRDYLESKLSVPDDPDGRPELEDRDPVAPGFDLVEIYAELVEEGQVSDRARELWREARSETPDGG